MEEGGGRGRDGSITESFMEEGAIPHGFSTHSQVRGTTREGHEEDPIKQRSQSGGRSAAWAGSEHCWVPNGLQGATATHKEPSPLHHTVQVTHHRKQKNSLGGKRLRKRLDLGWTSELRWDSVGQRQGETDEASIRWFRDPDLRKDS